ncbi:MAG: hypothetical protein JWQ32_60 [Marmoricola sp.]|nr:hypothetical protein [Marmoricola sp.]
MKMSLWTRLTASPWLIPMTGLWVIAVVGRKLVEALGSTGAAALIVVLGGASGWAWYALSPRPLARRLFPFVVLAAFLGVLSLVPGSSTNVDVPGVFAIPGIVVGLGLAELYLRSSAASRAD